MSWSAHEVEIVNPKLDKLSIPRQDIQSIATHSCYGKNYYWVTITYKSRKTVEFRLEPQIAEALMEWWSKPGTEQVR